MMNVARKVREKYLDAVTRMYGELCRKKTTVDYRGGTHFVVKLPWQDNPQLVTVGELDLMSDALLRKLEEQKAAA